MKKNIKWRLLVILGVLVLSIFLAYPPSKIPLGLDLSGGMHLVLQVVTDDAINAETDNEILRLQEQLKKENLTYERISKSEDRVGRFTIPGAFTTTAYPGHRRTSSSASGGRCSTG